MSKINFIGKYFKENPNTEKTCNFITFGGSHNFEQYNNENDGYINNITIKNGNAINKDSINQLSFAL